MASNDPSKSFQNVFDARGIFQHHEKMKVADALEFDEALEKFEIIYKKGLAASAPSQLSKFRDVLVGDSKIQTALSKLKGGVVVNPPTLVVTGLNVQSRDDLPIRRLVQSDILNNIVPRSGVLVCTDGSTGPGEMQATLRMSGVFTDDESSVKWLELLKTAPGVLCITKAFTEALKCMNANKDAERSDDMPLVDVPYEVGEKESAEEATKLLERKSRSCRIFWIVL